MRKVGCDAFPSFRMPRESMVLFPRYHRFSVLCRCRYSDGGNGMPDHGAFWLVLRTVSLPGIFRRLKAQSPSNPWKSKPA